MKHLFYRLIIFLDSSSEKDTNYNIAWYMAHNFAKVAKMGISQLAKECYVSPATISRFCRSLGYENFAHLKQECSAFASDARKFNNLINIPLEMMIEDPVKSTETYCNQVASVISKLPSRLDWDVIDQVLKHIHDCETVAFFGTQFSHSAALHFQTDLLMLEKFTMAYMENDSQLECAKSLDQNSIAIIVSVTGNFLNLGSKIMAYLKKSGCKIVLMTSNPHTNEKVNADYVILLGETDFKKIGKHTLLTTMELMSLRYYAMYYPTVKQQIV